MPGIRVAIDATDPIRLRAVSALLADHRIDRVGVLGHTPPGSWGSRAVAIDSAGGWDVVVGIDPVGGQVDVTVGSDGAVSGAGPTGLARALGTRLGDAALAGTVPGEPLTDGPRFAFPPPLGWLRGELVDDLHHCPVRSTLAGVLAVRPDGRSLAIVDEREFLDACALAAGVVLAAGGHTGPVWNDADRYVVAVEAMGLVTADSTG